MTIFRTQEQLAKQISRNLLTESDRQQLQLWIYFCDEAVSRSIRVPLWRPSRTTAGTRTTVREPLL